jgi:pimeloyl-ACP methyl ester carboxylesterase
MAREHYPWAPVGLLLRHRIETADTLRRATAPTALIAAANDTIVPRRRTEPVRRAVPNLVFDRTIAGADHNDLYERPAFRAAMAEAMARISASHGDSVVLPER